CKSPHRHELIQQQVSQSVTKCIRRFTGNSSCHGIASSSETVAKSVTHVVGLLCYLGRRTEPRGRCCSRRSIPAARRDRRQRGEVQIGGGGVSEEQAHGIDPAHLSVITPLRS